MSSRDPELKPSSVVPVSTKMTEFEKTILDAVAVECGITRSLAVRIAVVMFLEKAIKKDLNDELKLKLAPGYLEMFEMVYADLKKQAGKCASMMRGDGAEQKQ
ncbi:MAG: hypothetical protein N3F67_00035 [Acidilobaceae archaeon]|nr:hypothetical protein [Acidilobaceae archaeon]